MNLNYAIFQTIRKIFEYLSKEKRNNKIIVYDTIRIFLIFVKINEFILIQI